MAVHKLCTDLHEEAMNRLCFVCTDIIKGQHISVEENKELLSRALSTPGLFLLPGITPYYYCKKCSSAVKRAARGESIRSTRELQEWGECGDDCASCLLLSKRKTGAGRKKVSEMMFSRYRLNLTSLLNMHFCISTNHWLLVVVAKFYSTLFV